MIISDIFLEKMVIKIGTMDLVLINEETIKMFNMGIKLISYRHNTYKATWKKKPYQVNKTKIVLRSLVLVSLK